MKTRIGSIFALSIPVALIALTGASPAAIHSDSANHADSAAVAAVVENFHRALESGDSARVMSLLASDASVLESGSIESRGEYRSHHLAADIEFARSVKSVRESLNVRVAGDAAWTAGTSSTQGEFRGRSINSVGAESMILTKSASGWKIRSIHWSSRTRRTAGS
jgi:ketosteroid isomerase-like protein